MVLRAAGSRHDQDSHEFDRIIGDDRVLLMLHHGGDEHGPALKSNGELGSGFLLWIYVNDLAEVYRRAQRLGAEIVRPPHNNPRAHWREFTLRDLDGYCVALVEA